MKLEDLKEVTLKCTSDVLEKMMFIDLVPDTTTIKDSFFLEKELLGHISFKGEISGHLVLNCSKNFAEDATMSMLGLEKEELVEAQVEDTVKELVNMILGSILCNLDENKSLATLDIPKYINLKKDAMAKLDYEEVIVMPFKYTSMEDFDEAGNDEMVYIEIGLVL